MGAASGAYRRADLLRIKETVEGELARIDSVLGKLDHRLKRQVGRDLSSEELVLIFVEERTRLQAQLEAINLSLEPDFSSCDPIEYNRSMEATRDALLSKIF